MLANPLHVRPGEPRGNSLLERFPYLLPNLVAAGLFLVGILTGFLFLEVSFGDHMLTAVLVSSTNLLSGNA